MPMAMELFNARDGDVHYRPRTWLYRYYIIPFQARSKLHFDDRAGCLLTE